MEFNQPIVQVDGRKLKCTDRNGCLLVSSVQITQELAVPPRTEMVVPSRVTTKKFCLLGVIERQTHRLSRKPPYQGQAKGKVVPRKQTVATDIYSQPLATEYKIHRLPQARPAPDTSSQPSEPLASPPPSLRASEVPLPEGEGLGRRRWHAHTAPQIEVVEVNARTTLERLLERSHSSRSVSGLRTRRAATLETDAGDLEDRARRQRGGPDSAQQKKTYCEEKRQSCAQKRPGLDTRRPTD